MKTRFLFRFRFRSAVVKLGPVICHLSACALALLAAVWAARAGAVAGDVHAIAKPPWAAPVVPPAPERAKNARGVSLEIFGPGGIASGGTLRLRVTLVNRGERFFPLAGSIPVWLNFPGTWCWGPSAVRPTHLLRSVGEGYRTPNFTSRVATGAKPGGRYALVPLDVSHIFDLSVPGKYKAQLAGMGMVSNVIKFRVLPPDDKPTAPAIREYGARSPKGIVWGKVWHGMQIASEVKGNPDVANPTARVRILFHCAGKHAAVISMTGNPHIDFSRRKMIGPFHTIATIDGKSVPLTAYGKLLAERRRNLLPAAKVYTLRPGIVYVYWRPLVLNREFDLSVYGPYRFSTRLHGTQLRTAPAMIYVGVQSRFYKHLKIPE